MELSRKVIKIDNRNFSFFGVVDEQKMMAVTHIVDVSKASMYMFYHPDLMNKKDDTSFDHPIRSKVLATAKRKFGISSARCFHKYECVLNTVPDSDGDNAIDIVDREAKRSILLPFIEQHWGIKL